jgi:hypothetical protein
MRDRFRFSNAMKHLAWLLICMGVATAAGAQDIHKCVAEGAVVYQTAPCDNGQIEAGVLKLPAYADPPERDGATAPVAHPPADDAPDASPLPAPPVLQAGFPDDAPAHDDAPASQVASAATTRANAGAPLRQR